MILLAADDAKRRSGTSTQKRARLIRRQWLVAASAGTIAAATPGFYGGRASAQALPAECTDSGGDGAAENGETITCVAASPLVIDGVSTTASDLTIVIGDASTPTTVTGTGEGVKMSGDGAQTLTILNPGSVVEGVEGVDITVSTQSSTGDLTIVSEGEIRGSSTGNGITARNFGSGATTITVNDVTGKNAIYATVRDSGGDLTVSSDGVVKSLGGRAIYASVGDAGGVGDLTIDTSGGVATGGYVSGTIYAIQNGVGDIYIKTGNVTAGGAGVRATNVPGGGLVTVDTSAGTVSGGSVGVSATQISNTYLNIKVDDVSGGVGVLARGRGPTVIELTSTADVEGTTGAGVDAQTTGGNILLTGPSGANTGLSGAIEGATDGVYMRSGTSLQPNVTGGSITIRDLAAITGAGGHGLDIDSYGGAVAISDIANITGFGDATTPGDQGHGIKVVSQDGDVSTQRVGLGQNNLVEGKEGAGIYVSSGAGNIDIGGEVDSATGAVTGVGNITGSANGIDTLATTGVTEITLDATATIVGLAGAGISAQSAPGSQNQGGDILVRGLSGGAVTGATDGALLQTAGADITVKTLASITGKGGDGLNLNSGGGAVTISGVTSITGYGDGDASNVTFDGNGVRAISGNGDISIQGVGLIEGRDGHGIFAVSGTGGINIGGATAIGDVKGELMGVNVNVGAGGAGGLTINTTGGAVEAVRFSGINARNYSAGATTITTANVEGGAALYGIYAYNAASAGNMIVTTSAGAVSGAAGGIRVNQKGTGSASLTVGEVSGGVGVDVDTTSGAAEITLTSTADVEGTTGAGVDAWSKTGNVLLKGSLTPQGQLSGQITGATHGVDLRSGGFNPRFVGGDITVKDLDAVTGQGGNGIDVWSSDGAVTVSNIANVTGVQGAGVDVDINGDVSIQGLGVGDGNLVEGKWGHGIYAYSTYGGINIGGVTPIGNVKGSSNGISANLDSSEGGAMTIDTSAGSVTGGLEGIGAHHNSDELLSITVGDVVGGRIGIDASANGGGAMEITLTSTANVVGETGAGVRARASPNWNSLTGASGSILLEGETGGADRVITGATDGVFLRSQGNVGGGGNITVKDLDAVTGQGGDGIYAWSNGGDIMIANIANVTGVGDPNTVGYEGDGIVAATSGDISIQGLGLGDGNLVEGREGAGISVYSDTGDVNIGGATAIGNVKASHNGIDAEIGTGGLALTINTSGGAVEGGNTGIRAFNFGDGAVSITTADVTGRGEFGVEAYNFVDGAGVVIDTSAGLVTSGEDDAIRARNYGAGPLSITAGAVDARAGGEFADAIDARSESDADVTIVSTGPLSAADDGIDVRQEGNGALSITATGTVSGGDTGILAYNTNDGDGALTIMTTGAVSGGVHGIIARNESYGAVVITAADVTAETGIGVFGRNSRYGGDLTIDTSAGSVTGGFFGIYARNYSYGALSITANNIAALGGGGRAIRAVNSVNGASMTIATSGTVVSADGDGVGVMNRGGALTIMATGAISGAGHGITAINYGGGGVSITAADVTGTNAAGVYVQNIGGDYLTIDTSAGAVKGGREGIRAGNFGVGAFAITAADVTGAADDGVSVYNSARSSDLTINANEGALTGFLKGIDAENQGSGATVITIAGAVAGETEEGVRAATANGATIIVEDGGSAAGATAAIVTDSAAAPGGAVDDALTINAGGSVDGDALLLAGDDTFNDAGGSFTTVFGGDGLDTVNFTGGARTLTGSGAAGDSIQEFEVFNIGSDGLVLAGAHVGLSEANFLAGANTLAGSLEAAAAVIAPGATLNAADGAILTGVLTNNGTLNVGDSPGTFRVNGDLVLGATSVLPMEVGATSDHIVVSGEVILGGALDIITLQGTPAGVVTRTIIDGRAGVSGAFDTITSENGLLINQTVSVNPVGSDVLLTTSVSTASSLDGLNNNQTTVGDSLIGLLNDPSLDPALLGLIGAVGAIEDIDALGSTLGELTPEGLDIGLKFMTTSQSRFIDAALGQTLRSGAEPEAVRLASLSGGPVAASADGVATAWGALETYRFSQGGGFDHVGFDGAAFSFAAGVSGVAAGPVSFGIAGGYSNFNGDADGALGDAADANLFHIAGTAGVRFNIRDFDTRVDTVVGYATGDSEVAMRLVDPVADEVILQRGDAGVSSFDWMTRMTLDGTKGDEWAVKPYFQTGVTVYRQDAVDVGPATNATALRVDELDNSRWQIGFGATYERRIDDRLSVNARAAALQYFNDTENAFASRFAAAPEGTPAFRTAGREVDRQFQFDAALAYEHKSGVVFSVGAFGEAGDLNLYGGNLRLRKRF